MRSGGQLAGSQEEEGTPAADKFLHHDVKLQQTSLNARKGMMHLSQKHCGFCKVYRLLL